MLSTILGNGATAARLLDSLSVIPDVEAVPLMIGPDAFLAHPAPRWARATCPWELQYVTSRALEASTAARDGFNMLLVNSWESVTALQRLARAVPALALLDAVPATFDRQIRERSGGGFKRSLSFYVHSFAFRKAVSAFDTLLPMGSDCAESLATDYGYAAERCHVTLAPQDLDTWRTPIRSRSGPLRLLFVGNDFERKGGCFLLDLYSRYLSSTCSLTIASNDPQLGSVKLPEGVTLLRGRTKDQLLVAYQDADLFVLPTRQDFMPQVLCEALAMGLPCIANDVGGIRDLVQTGKTGTLMTTKDPPELWADAIHRLQRNDEELSRLSKGARTLAEARLGLPRFHTLIHDVVSRLRLVKKSG